MSKLISVLVASVVALAATASFAADEKAVTEQKGMSGMAGEQKGMSGMAGEQKGMSGMEGQKGMSGMEGEKRAWKAWKARKRKLPPRRRPARRSLPKSRKEWLA